MSRPCQLQSMCNYSKSFILPSSRRASSLVPQAMTVLFVQLLVLRISAILLGIFVKIACFIFACLSVISVGSSFSTGTASLSKTHVLSFHVSIVACV